MGALGALTIASAYWEHTGRYDAYSSGPLHFMWAAIALFMLLPAAFPQSGRGIPARVLSTRLLVWLGLVSYGVYLWHLPLLPELGRATSDVAGTRVAGPLLTIILFALIAAASAACAAASYYLLERPILRFKGSFASRRAAATLISGSSIGRNRDATGESGA
jgi:peptidoglycan/LPS O-acetylase OafA/YrhL